MPVTIEWETEGWEKERYESMECSLLNALYALDTLYFQVDNGKLRRMGIEGGAPPPRLN